MADLNGGQALVTFLSFLFPFSEQFLLRKTLLHLSRSWSAVQLSKNSAGIQGHIEDIIVSRSSIISAHYFCIIQVDTISH